MTDYTKLDAGDFLQAVGTDAHKWASAFMQIWGCKLDQVDHGLMIGWFANAIMVQYDESEKVITTLRAELDRLKAAPSEGEMRAISVAICEERNHPDWPCREGLDFDGQLARAAIAAFLQGRAG